VALLVVLAAPVSMASLNAARDLGPRLFMALTGWGRMAFPGPRGDWWVTTVVPTVGAVAGAYFYDFVVRPFLPQTVAKPAPAPGRTTAA